MKGFPFEEFIKHTPMFFIEIAGVHRIQALYTNVDS